MKTGKIPVSFSVFLLHLGVKVKIDFVYFSFTPCYFFIHQLSLLFQISVLDPLTDQLHGLSLHSCPAPLTLMSNKSRSQSLRLTFPPLSPEGLLILTGKHLQLIHRYTSYVASIR